MLVSEKTDPVSFTRYWKPFWTEREDQRLMNSYGKRSKEEMLILFPDRTWTAIKIKAYKLKITKKILPWTKEEEIRLFKNYKKTPKETVLKLFPGRTWEALKSKASTLNIPRNGLPYTPDEDSLLLKLRNETNLTYDQMSRFFMFRSGIALRFRMAVIGHMENRVDILDKKVKEVNK